MDSYRDTLMHLLDKEHEADPNCQNVLSILPREELELRLALIEKIDEVMTLFWDSWEPDSYYFVILLLAPIKILRDWSRNGGLDNRLDYMKKLVHLCMYSAPFLDLPFAQLCLM